MSQPAALRSAQVGVKVTEADKERLKRYAASRQWSESYTAAWLIKRGLDSIDRSREQAAARPRDGE